MEDRIFEEIGNKIRTLIELEPRLVPLGDTQLFVQLSDEYDDITYDDIRRIRSETLDLPSKTVRRWLWARGYNPCQPALKYGDDNGQGQVDKCSEKCTQGS